MPQRIDTKLLKRLHSARTIPEREVEITDSEQVGFVLKHLPSGAVRFYAIIGRSRRETIAHEQGSGRRAVKRGNVQLWPVDARDVLDRSKAGITLKWVRKECRRLQGEAIGGEDYTEKRKAQREIPTFARFLHDVYGPWLTDNPDHRDAPGTLARLEKAFIKDFGKDKLDAIETSRLDTWKVRKLKNGAKATTVNRDLNALKSAFFTYAKWNKTFDNPLRRYKGITVDTDEEIVRAFKKDEVAKLLKACAERDERKRAERASANEWRHARGYEPLPTVGVYADCLTPAVIVSIETGLRRGELFKLCWPFVNFETRILQVKPETAKSAKTREVPLSDTAHKAFRDWWMQQGQPKRGRVFPVGNLKKSFYPVIADAGIERIGADGKRLNWHSLRHTFGTRLVAASVDLITVRDLMGHKSVQTTERYTHSDEERKREAVQAPENNRRRAAVEALA